MAGPWSRWLFVSAALVFFGARMCRRAESPASGLPADSLESGAPNAPDVPPKGEVGAKGLDGAEQFRVCGWNVQKLGHGTKKDYALVAKVVDDYCDVVVLTEVMQKRGGHRGYDQLLSHLASLGPTFDGWITSSPRPNTPSGNSEFYAILSRGGLLSTCHDWSGGLRYLADNDGGPQATGQDRFSREPAFGCFVVEQHGKKFDFLLGAYHATYRGGDRDKIAEEVKQLDTAFRQLEQLRPGERDILLVGDFNLRAARLKASTRASIMTVGTGSTLRPNGSRSKNLVDHLLIWEPAQTPEISEPAQVLDVRALASSARVFRSSVSDHLPIQFVVRLQGGDDD